MNPVCSHLHAKIITDNFPSLISTRLNSSACDVPLPEIVIISLSDTFGLVCKGVYLSDMALLLVNAVISSQIVYQ